jgi:hypothetical protein
VVAASGALSALLATGAGTHPVGTAVADTVVAALLGGLVVLLASRASWITLLLGAGLVLAAGTTPQRGLALILVAAVLVLGPRDQLGPVPSALVALAIVQCALRLPAGPTDRFSAVVAALALVPMAVSGALHLPARVRRPALRAGAVAGGLVGLAVVMAVVGMIRASWAIEQAQSSARDGLEAAQAGDPEGAAEHLSNATDSFASVRSVAGGWSTWPSRQLPGVAQQFEALHDAADTGARASAVALASARDIDLDRLRLRGGRFDLDAIRDYQAVLERAQKGLHALRSEVPEGNQWLVPPVTNGLDRLERTLAEADESAATAVEATRLAPDMLGGDRPHHYFVAFVTPAEARASGGFMGNHAVLTLDDGKMSLGPIGRTIDLNLTGDRKSKHLDGPADYLARYDRFGVERYWQNVTMSPDWPTVGQVIADLYPQSGGRRVDGVMRLDPVALSGLLSLTGPIEVPGLDDPVDEENIVPYLLRGQYGDFSQNTERKEILGYVGRATFQELTSGAGASPSEVAEAMSSALRNQNFAMWMADPDEQAFIRRIHADAGVDAEGGDAFGVTNQNAGASKIDSFLRRTITYRATVDAATGKVRATASVVLENTAPAKGRSRYLIGNSVGLPLGWNRSYVSIYSALVPTKVTLDGEPLDLPVERELGLNVVSDFIDIGPGAERRIEIELEGGLDLSSGWYRFTYVPQVQNLQDAVSWRADLVGATPGRVVTHGGIRDAEASGSTVDLTLERTGGPWSVDLTVEATDRS